METADKFSIRIQTDEIRFRYARGMPVQEREFHTQHEIFFLIKGELDVISEMGRKKIMPDTALIIPKGVFHQFAHGLAEQDCERCVFKMREIKEFSELIEAKFHRIQLVKNAAITEVFRQLQAMAQSDRTQGEKQILLKAYLAQILVFLDCRQEESQDASTLLSPITREAIDYISRNIRSNLTLQTISEQLHISSSHLSHIFKVDMHFSIHKYILNKRLILANEKIVHGVSPVEAAASCGFRDYSNFYLQYKKRFDRAPSVVSKRGKKEE